MRSATLLKIIGEKKVHCLLRDTRSLPHPPPPASIPATYPSGVNTHIHKHSHTLSLSHTHTHKRAHTHTLTPHTTHTGFRSACHVRTHTHTRISTYYARKYQAHKQRKGTDDKLTVFCRLALGVVAGCIVTLAVCSLSRC